MTKEEKKLQKMRYRSSGVEIQAAKFDFHMKTFK